MIYLGDFAADTAQVDFSFNTRKADGTPVALVGGVVAVYKDDATTALVLSADCDIAAVATGQYNVTVYVTQPDSPFVAGSDYKVVLSAGTVDGTSVAGTVLAQFSIENRVVTAAAPAAATVADAVWDELIAGHSGAGSTGDTLADILAGVDPAMMTAVIAAVSALGAGNVTVTSPVTATGEVTIIQGDTYSASEVAWTDSGNTWPAGLDTADRILCCIADEAELACTFAADTITLDALSCVETAALAAGRYPYWLEAQWDGDPDTIKTIGRGTFTVTNERPEVTA